MHLFAFGNQEEIDTVVQTFKSTNPNWKITLEDRDTHSGFPAAAVSRLDHPTSTIVLHFLDADSVISLTASLMNMKTKSHSQAYMSGQQAFFNGYNAIDVSKFFADGTHEAKDWLQGLNDARRTAELTCVPRHLLKG